MAYVKKYAEFAFESTWHWNNGTLKKISDADEYDLVSKPGRSKDEFYLVRPENETYEEVYDLCVGMGLHKKIAQERDGKGQKPLRTKDFGMITIDPADIPWKILNAHEWIMDRDDNDEYVSNTLVDLNGKSLYTAQEFLSGTYLEGMKNSGSPAEVVKFRDGYLVVDGHHRIAYCVKNNKDCMVREWDVEEINELIDEN